MFTHSIATTQALTLLIVVSEACHNSIDPFALILNMFVPQLSPYNKGQVPSFLNLNVGIVEEALSIYIYCIALPVVNAVFEYIKILSLPAA